MGCTYVDLSHTIRHGLMTYKGLPAPIICDYLSREASRKNYQPPAEFQIGKVEMVGNTGTYIDCPFHRFADGKDFDAIDLEQLADLPAVVVRLDYRERLDVRAEDFNGINVSGKAVLVNTRWSENWNTPAYFDNHPFLTQEAAEHLRDQGAVLVGIDSHNIDDTRSRNSRPVHSALLGNDILIVEHLSNLQQLPPDNFFFSAIPPKLAGIGTFPVRAFARLS